MARPKATELTDANWKSCTSSGSGANRRRRSPRDAGHCRSRLGVHHRRHARADSDGEGVRAADQRRAPFRYEPIRTFDDVSGRLLGDLVKRVFRGSREHLLVRLTEDRKLTAKERALLEKILREQQQ